MSKCLYTSSQSRRHGVILAYIEVRGLQEIINYRRPSPDIAVNSELPDYLNVFYCRFKKPTFTPITYSSISVSSVKRMFVSSRKVRGPDRMSPSCLKVCDDQLAPIFTKIFNRSLELCEVPSCFKSSTIIPVPKKPAISGLNNYICGHEVL